MVFGCNGLENRKAVIIDAAHIEQGKMLLQGAPQIRVRLCNFRNKGGVVCMFLV